MKDKDKSGKGPNGLDGACPASGSRRHTVEGSIKAGSCLGSWTNMLDWNSGASHTALLYTFLHWFITYFNSSALYGVPLF